MIAGRCDRAITVFAFARAFTNKAMLHASVLHYVAQAKAYTNNANLDRGKFEFYKIDCCAAIRGHK